MREYLLLKRHSLEDWRRFGESTHASQVQRLLKQADSHHDDLPPSAHPSDSITYIGTAVLNLGLAYLLTGEDRYVHTARRWIKRAISYGHWGKERMPDHDLDAAWLLFGLGLGYDWLKDVLPPDERDALRDKLIAQGQKLYDFALISEGKWWSSAYWQNHNWICYGGLAVAAYALCSEFRGAGSWAARARDNFLRALSYMPEDGSDYEGPVYWRYGIIWFLIYADLLQQETGEDLHDSEFLRNTFYYRLYLSGPNLIDTANFGDCHDRRSAHTAAVYARLAGLYKIGEAQWLYHHFYETGEWDREGAEGLVKPGLWAESGLEFLWYQPEVEASPIADLPLSRAFPDLGLMAMRSSWDREALAMAFKCGAPNGMKAWHSGHMLNRRHGWETLNAGHDHPDANSFIVIKGDDYIAVDDGYAKSKQTAHHSTLLIDGRGQYAEGTKNAFRNLDETWSARLEASFVFEDVVYARGEAARAYAPDLGLRQFTREMLFLEGDAVVLRDTVSADAPHRFDWLLQTDNPPEAMGCGRFTIKSGGTACRLHALEPDEIDHRLSEQEITANPTSAKPDWIISNTQYALALRPPEPRKDCSLLLILDLADFTVESMPAERGLAASLSNDALGWRLGFARGRDGIIAEGLNVDGRWFAGRQKNNRFDLSLAGEVTSLWLDGELHFVADRPVDIALRRSAEGARLNITAADSAWIRFKSAKPNKFSLNGRDDQFHYDEATGMVWARVRAGKTKILVS
ncbi:MAG: DUF4962 domain-containing protein [Chloroflexi bacterium]|nr:DUF4962 domain-containing protein [Chloroflexota bacterium]